MQCAWMNRHDHTWPCLIHGRKTRRVSRGALSRCSKLGSGTIIEKMTQGPPGWSRGDSNPGPPPCKGGALPTKLRPQNSSQQTHPLVGAPGLEPGTSALSGPRSDHLSYAPVATPSGWSSSNTVWRPDISGYLCPRRSARSRSGLIGPACAFFCTCRGLGVLGSWLGGIPLPPERLCQHLNPQGGARGSVPQNAASSPHRLTSG